jgi:hypothetical protein
MSDKGEILKWLRLVDDSSSDIFFGCVATVISSTFLALHLHVPAPPPDAASRALRNRWYHSRNLYLLGRQLLWSVMVIVAPELLGSLAFSNWGATKIGLDVMGQFGQGELRY